MSTAPSLPPNYEPPDESLLGKSEPPRRPRWPRVLGWMGIGVLAFVTLVMAAVTFALHSPRLHRYLLVTAQEKATAALGTKVNIQEFALNFSGISPTLDVYGVTVAGAAPYQNTQLLQVEHARVGIRVVSLLGRKWYLSDVEVHHPVVQLFVDKSGQDNLPQTQNSTRETKSNTSIFDIGVRHALLDRGELYYNNNKSVMSADVRELNFQAGFAVGQQRYSGTMGYKDGHLFMQTFNPIPHELEAQFDITPQQLTIHHASLRSGNSNISLNATVSDFDHPHVQAKYDAVVDAGEFRTILKNATVPVGLINLTGTLQVASQPNKPLITVMTLQGEMKSNSLVVHMPSFSGVVRNIMARYALENGNVEVTGLRAIVLGGALSGAVTMRDIVGKSQSRLNVTLRGAQLSQAKAMLNSPYLNKIAVGGTVNLDADATWGRTFDDLNARTNAVLNATLGPPAVSATTNGAPGSVPLNGIIHANYASASKQITLADSSVHTPQTTLTLNGTVSNRSALQVQMRSNDLHELETMADMFSAPAPGKPAQPMDLYGTAEFNGAISGTTSAPHITGQLQAQNLRVRGTAWRSLRTMIDAGPTNASLRNGELVSANRGRMAFNLSTGLRDWSYTENSPLQISVNASQLNVAELARAAGSTTPVAGTLAMNVRLQGTQLSPVGEGTIDLTQAKISGETIPSANVRFNGTGDAVHATANLRLPAGVANAVLTYFPKQQGYEAQVSAKGIRLDQLQAVKDRNMKIAGVINLNASGKGTIKDPQMTATVAIPELRVQEQTISSISLQANVANHVANFVLDSTVLNAPIRGRGTVSLTGDYNANITLDTPTIALQPLVAAYAPSQADNITGQTELHATLRGPLKNKNMVEAHLTIPVLSLNYSNTVQIAAPQPIRIDLVNGVLNLQRAALRGTGTDMQIQGTLPLNSNAPAPLLAVGTIDLRLAQLFDPDTTSSGQLRFNINSYGERSDPNVQGTVEIVNATYANGDMPVGLSNGNGVLTLTKDRLVISNFKATAGGGTVTARGGVVYRPTMQFDLALFGDGIRVLMPAGIRTGVSANITLTGTLEEAVLRGQVNVDKLSFTPDFDVASAIGSLGGTSSAPPSQGFSNNVRLDLAVRSAGGVNLVSRELSLQGTANLNVRGSAADPVITGRVNLSNGDLIFRGNRYLLQSGTIDFVNPTRTQANVNMGITTSIQQYNISMRFEGPIDRLRTSYNSDPSLPPSDIINLLAFGKTTEASDANPTPPGTLGAQSVIASAVSGQVTNRLQKFAGISQLSVDPTLGSNTQNPGATVTIQQRVTGKIFVTFSTDVTGTQRNVIQVQYQKSPRLSFSGTRDQNGGFAVDVRIHKNW